ncbi:hypothetical protein SAMN02745174_02338 [Cetobacterium ceti]|uniref:Prepilin-type N-terminal cleavage/methylation domain-containing protein n=1 Tax=Cetobacterium ceti TaxID=180163 RepID=A0A1T4QI76_9FUSO|nr:hypothetical protein [Cetobacterium ceti]SKA03503.1 hypothetical protein SAMN02745174_02338 [Cetobacterium ceti]
MKKGFILIEGIIVITLMGLIFLSYLGSLNNIIILIGKIENKNRAYSHMDNVRRKLLKRKFENFNGIEEMENGNIKIETRSVKSNIKKIKIIFIEEKIESEIYVYKKE